MDRKVETRFAGCEWTWRMVMLSFAFFLSMDRAVEKPVLCCTSAPEGGLKRIREKKGRNMVAI